VVNKTFENHSEQDVRQTFDVNIISQFWVSTYELRGFTISLRMKKIYASFIRTFLSFLSFYLQMLQAFLPSMMEKNSGHIVCISSLAGIKGVANISAYCSSKFAITGKTNVRKYLMVESK